MRTGCFNSGQELQKVARLDLICLLIFGLASDRSSDRFSDGAPQTRVQQHSDQNEFLQQLSYADKANTATTTFARSRTPRMPMLALLGLGS